MVAREYEPSQNEREFVNKALAEGIRHDGRELGAMRPIRIALGPPLGSAHVQLGRTRVMASVSCEIVRPNPGNPNDGVLRFNTEFSQMASPTFEGDRFSEEETLLSRLLEKALRRSHAVDTEGLCIVAGEKVWAIRIDVRVLDHEGNLVDCACIAAMCALLHFRRPDVSVDGQDVVVHSLEEKIPIPLSVHHIPVCITFGFFNDGETQIIDPSLLEEQVQQGDMTIVVNAHQELCTLSKAGGIPITLDRVMHCADVAAAKAAEITKLIRQALSEDAAKRKQSKEQ